MNIKKIAIAAMGFVMMGTVTMAQSLEDARNAVTAEQYQKAKGLFKNLTTTQPTNAENFFYYGDLYLILDNADSAKVLFEKGIAANPKFTLNYIGLGTVNLFNKNEAQAQANFSKATDEMRRKDYKEYIYIGKAYTYEQSKDLDKAFQWFEKARENGEKDPELYVALGNAYKARQQNSEAVAEYQRAASYAQDLPSVDVNIGEIWTQAYNFELAESTLQGVVSKHTDFGPAYRALAENYYRWASREPAKRTDLLPKAKEYYSKYLDRTDRSADSRYRYLIFLYNAQDYATLEKEASSFISQFGNKEEYALAQRLLGYAAIENGNTQAGIDAVNKFISSVKSDRIIASDYVFLGNAYRNLKQDSIALQNYIKGYELDTTNIDVLNNIAKAYFATKQYGKAAQYYEILAAQPKSTSIDWFYFGYSNYWHYAIELANQKPADSVAIKETLIKADSAFRFVAEKTNNADAWLYDARVNYYLDPSDKDQNAVNAYQKYIDVTAAKEAATQTDREKTSLVEAYSYIGGYFITKDKAKAKENFNKALAIDPDNTQVKDALRAMAAEG